MPAGYTVAAIRAGESELMARAPESELMARAAAGLASVCAGLLAGARGGVYGATVLVLAGSGSNGGDALHAGALLARRGARLEAVTLWPRWHTAGALALRRAGGRLRGWEELDPADWARLLGGCDLVLDGMTGIGAAPGLRPPADRIAADLAAGAAPVVAVDLPSGIDPDTGELAGAAVRADVTVTFGAPKTGLLLDPAASLVGALTVIDIGLGPHLGAADVQTLTAAQVGQLLPRPDPAWDKYRRGVLGVLAGSTDFPGAAVLCVGAAVRAGAGMVRYLGPDPLARVVLARWPEAVPSRGRVQAWALGPGLAEPGLAGALLAGPEPAVVDAGALAGYLPGRAGATLLTPHAGELGRLLGVPAEQVSARRLWHARDAAARLGAVVLLKGSTTVVAAPDGRVRVNPTGTPWLATAGSGDVLTGLAGALLAGGLDPFDAGSVAAWLHGLAGRIAAERAGVAEGPGPAYAGEAPERPGEGPVCAQDVLAALPAAMARVPGGHTG